VALLARWLRDDILSVAGPEYAIRRDLLDFVVAELRAREHSDFVGLGSVLENCLNRGVTESLCKFAT